MSARKLRISPDAVSQLQSLLGGDVAEKDEQSIMCFAWGCSNLGIYYIRRILVDGMVKKGLYCEGCEKIFSDSRFKV